MPIDVKCPQCGKVLQARESAAGKRSTCPGCGFVVTIPELHEGYLPHGEMIAADLVSSVEDEKSGADRKPCPLCGEMIAKGAVKCRYCNEFVDPARRVSRQSQPEYINPANPNEDDLAAIDWVMTVCCPCLACFMGIVYLLQGKMSGAKLMGLSLVGLFLWAMLAGIISAGR